MHKTDNRMSDYHFRATANYSRTFDNRHTVNLFGGMETTDIDRSRTRFEGWGLQYESGEAPFYPYQYFKKSIEEGNDYYQLVNSNWRTVAFYGNATYSYRGRYVVNGTYRYEGSNQFGSQDRCTLDVDVEPFGCLERARREMVRATRSALAPHAPRFLQFDGYASRSFARFVDDDLPQLHALPPLCRRPGVGTGHHRVG